jgi:hypothetical protein
MSAFDSPCRDIHPAFAFLAKLRIASVLAYALSARIVAPGLGRSQLFSHWRIGGLPSGEF